MIRLLIFSIFFLSNSLADEQGYRFINDIEKNDVMDIEIITDMSQGGYNYISNFSGRISTEYEGFDGPTSVCNSCMRRSLLANQCTSVFFSSESCV